MSTISVQDVTRNMHHNRIRAARMRLIAADNEDLPRLAKAFRKDAARLERWARDAEIWLERNGEAQA